MPSYAPAPKPRQWLQWDGVAFTMGILIAILFVIYFSLYLPSYGWWLPWQALVVGGFGFWVTYVVLLPKFAQAILGARTGVLATMEGIWRISETSSHELDPITATVDYMALKQSGVQIPADLRAFLDQNSAMPQPGLDEKGRVIRAWYIKSGGYRMSKVWYDEPGADGFHLFIGFKPIDIGGKKRGGCMVSPCKPIAVSHAALPERWRQQLREDHMWVDDTPGSPGSSVWVHADPSPGFISGMKETAEFWKPFFDSAPTKESGTLTRPASYAILASSFVRITHLEAQLQESDNQNDKLRRALGGRADELLRTAGRRNDSDVAYRISDRIPDGSAVVR